MIVLSALLLAATVDPTPQPMATATATAVPTGAPSPSPSPAPAPTPLPTATSTAGATPAATASAALPAEPTAEPTNAPTATPIPYHYRFVPHQPAHPTPGEPQIFAVYLNEKKLRSLGPIDIRVETSPEVVKVVSRSNGRDGVVPSVAPGLFVAVGRLPKIPFIAEGMSVNIEFIATTADGRKVTVGVPVQLN